jgi:hypothetical protein
MLSTIPKLADKAFIIGFLLPVIIFFAALLFLFADLALVSDILKLLMSKDNIEKIVYLSLVVWWLSIVMMLLNHFLYQVVEGYKWPISTFAQAWSHEMRRFERKRRRLKELQKEWKVAGDQFPDAFKCEHDDLLIELGTQFPSEHRLILPTRFGNSIRAFEDYSRQVYGADSIPLWVHLNTVIPKEFQVSIEDARAQVSCLLNLFIFSLIIFTLSIARFLLSLRMPHSFNLNFSMLLKIVTYESMFFALFALLAAVLGWLAYEFSIDRICEWGSLVKAAFDCYLPDLAKRLGYKLPLTGDEQRRFWIAVSCRAIYHRPLTPEEWPRADDSDQGLVHNKNNTAKGRDNVSEERGGEADDTNGEVVENEKPEIDQ